MLTRPEADAFPLVSAFLYPQQGYFSANPSRPIVQLIKIDPVWQMQRLKGYKVLAGFHILIAQHAHQASTQIIKF